jgi:hypothetical protein
MVARKMTFSVSDELAQLFVRRVPSRERSRFVEEALRARLREEEADLVRACLEANQVADLLTIEEEFGALPDTMIEPWDGPTPTRG